MKQLIRTRVNELVQTSTKVKSNCHTIIFFNKGTNPFTVLDIEVLPNTQQMFFGQFENEIDQTIYELVFPSNFNIANNLCVVIREHLQIKEC